MIQFQFNCFIYQELGREWSEKLVRVGWGGGVFDGRGTTKMFGAGEGEVNKKFSTFEKYTPPPLTYFLTIPLKEATGCIN